MSDTKHPTAVAPPRAGVEPQQPPDVAADLASVFGAQVSGGWVAAMGLRFLRASKELVEVEWTVGQEHLQPFGLVHGGVYAGAIETVCSVGAALCSGPKVNIVGVENHTSFLRPATEGVLRAVGTPIHVGRRAQLWQAEVSQTGGRLLATGRLRVMCLTPERRS